MDNANPLDYFLSLKAADFDQYTAPRGVQLTAGQALALQELITRLPQNKHLLLYIWRFVFGINIKTIQRFTQIEHANGVVESFRFACKRYLEMEKTISDLGMAKAFAPILSNYEILFVSADNGICWFRDQVIDSNLIQAALETKRKNTHRQS